MNYKNIEKRIQEIINDHKYKFRKNKEYEDAIYILRFIMIEIAKSNDALGQVAYIKNYYLI